MTTPMDSNLVGGPAPTYLPDDPEPRRALEGGARAYAVVRSYPTSSLLWADLADEAYTEGRIVESYAYARAGYHRGLDALRRAGWRGHGPVPWEHEPNRGFLRSLHGLARAAAAIGEDDEATRCTLFLRDSSAVPPPPSRTTGEVGARPPAVGKPPRPQRRQDRSRRPVNS